MNKYKTVIYFAFLLTLSYLIGNCSNSGVNSRKLRNQSSLSSVEFSKLNNFLSTETDQGRRGMPSLEEQKKKEEEEQKKKEEERKRQEEEIRKRQEEESKRRKEEEEKKKKEEEMALAEAKKTEEIINKFKNNMVTQQRFEVHKFEVQSFCSQCQISQKVGAKCTFKAIDPFRKFNNGTELPLAFDYHCSNDYVKFLSDPEENPMPASSWFADTYKIDSGFGLTRPGYNQFQGYLKTLKDNLEKFNINAKKIKKSTALRKVNPGSINTRKVKKNQSYKTPPLKTVCGSKDLLGKGWCTSKTFDLAQTNPVGKQISNLIDNLLPKHVQEYKKDLNKVTEMVMRAAKVPQICYGDFDPALFADTETLRYSACADIPLPGGHKFGLLAYKQEDVPCGGKQKVDFCIAFDDCGTLSFVVNGGVLACASFATGIGAALVPFTKFVGDVGVSISPNGLLSLEFDIPNVKNGNDMELVTYDFRGHLSMTAGITIPFEELCIVKTNNKCSDKLDEYFEIENRVGTMVDFGDNLSNYLDAIKKLSNGDMFDVNPGKFLADNYKVAKKYGYQFTSIIKIKFDDLTLGFLPDLEVEVSKASVAIFTEEENGFLPGVYLYFSRNTDWGVGTVVQFLFDNFEFIFDALGLEQPELPLVSSAELSVVINTKFISIQVQAEDFVGIECYYKRSSGNGSCKIGGDFFTLIWNNLKWVLKKATAFFEDVGEEIMEFKSEAHKFTKNTAIAAYNYMKKQAVFDLQLYNSINGEFVNAGKVFAKDTKKLYETAIGEVKGTMENSFTTFKKVKQSGERVLFMTMDTLWKFATDEKKYQYLIKVGEKVKKYWKQRQANLEKDIKNLSQRAADASKRALDKSLEAMKKYSKQIEDKLKDVLDKVKDVLDEIGDKLEDALDSFLNLFD